jgi:hypothetical protein
MRFKIVGDHRNFFSKEKSIEFEDVFGLDQIATLSHQVDEALAQKSRKLIETETPDQLFKVGRDLWRDSPEIRQFVCNRRFAEIAAQLFDQKFLQLGFTQVFRSTCQTGLTILPSSTLQQISCIQPLAGAAIIRLEEGAPISLLPKKRENVVFVAPDQPISWDIFCQEQNQSFLLIAFAPKRAVYVLEKKDLHTHEMKKLGYVFGDRLKDSSHPVLIS